MVVLPGSFLILVYLLFKMSFYIIVRSSQLHYDGLGGRSKTDEFPQPKGIMSSSQSFKINKNPKPIKNKPVGLINKQSKTIDKFFGSFDTP